MKKKSELTIPEQEECFFDMFSGLPAQDPFDIKKDHFAADLAALMVHAGKSRAEVARDLGWPKSRITNVLSGRGNPTAKTIYEFCSGLGYDVDLVFRLPSDLPASQPWEKSDWTQFETSPTCLHLNVQTAEQVATDFVTGSMKPYYLSVSGVSSVFPEILDLHVPPALEEAPIATQFSSLWSGVMTSIEYESKDLK